MLSIVSKPLSNDYSLSHPPKMSALNLGKRLIAFHPSQASHRLLTRTTIKPIYSPRRPTTTSTYLPTFTSNLQIRSYSKHPRPTIDDFAIRKQALSNASTSEKPSNEDARKHINKSGVASNKLKPRVHPPNHVPQIHKHESLVWGEDSIGYQIEHQLPPCASEDDVGEGAQTAKNNTRKFVRPNQTVFFKNFFDAWLADDDIPREKDIEYQGLLSMSHVDDERQGVLGKSQGNAGGDACRTCRKECLFAGWKEGEDSDD